MEQVADARQARGFAIAKSARIKKVTESHWVVPSATHSGTYVVDVVGQTCTCPDHEDRRVKCKHIWALEYARHQVVEADGSKIVQERQVKQRDIVVVRLGVVVRMWMHGIDGERLAGPCFVDQVSSNVDLVLRVRRTMSGGEHPAVVDERAPAVEALLAFCVDVASANENDARPIVRFRVGASNNRACRVASFFDDDLFGAGCDKDDGQSGDPSGLSHLCANVFTCRTTPPASS